MYNTHSICIWFVNMMLEGATWEWSVYKSDTNLVAYCYQTNTSIVYRKYLSIRKITSSQLKSKATGLLNRNTESLFAYVRNYLFGIKFKHFNKKFDHNFVSVFLQTLAFFKTVKWHHPVLEPSEYHVIHLIKFKSMQLNLVVVIVILL